MDSRLLSIKPISEISRAPRSFSDRKHWKASEFRSFLLYYSIPILQGILPTKYYKHYLLLVTSLRKLLGTSIEQKDIDKEMTINIHTLNHLPHTVQDLGPLWVYSCFFFESLNGILLQHVHGTQGLGLQFVSNFSYLQAFSSSILQMDCVPPFVGRIIKQSSNRFVHGSGRCEVISTTADELKELGSDNNIVRSYTRIKIDGSSYCVKSWHEDSRRHNSTIMFCHESKCHIGQIVKKFEIDRDFKLFIEITTCERINTIVSLPGFYKVVSSAPIVIIQPKDILEKCILMHVEGTDYISTIIDPFERD